MSCTRTLLAVVVVFFSSVAFTQDADQDEAISRALQKHEEELIAAKQGLTMEIEEVLKTTAETGDLRKVEVIVDQLKQWNEKAALPADPKLEPAKRIYKKKIEESVNRVRGVYEESVKTLTRQLKLEEAKRTEDAKNRFISRVMGQAKTAEADWEEVDLAKVGHMDLSARYNNPSSPYIFETWTYSLLPGVQQFRLIHTMDGEATPAYVNVPCRNCWYQIIVREDGYFWLSVRNSDKENIPKIRFVIKRYKDRIENR